MQDMTTISMRLAGTSRWATTLAECRDGLATKRARTARWLQSAWCVLNGGHYKLLHAAPDRIALRCAACGHTTPGWAVGSARFSGALSASGPRVFRRAV